MMIPFGFSNECADCYVVRRGDGKRVGEFKTVPEAVDFCQSRDDKMELSISMFVKGEMVGNAVQFRDICE